jgi:5-methylcytosine-specific restriction enzyme B
MYPEAMTSIASIGHMHRLARALGAPRGLEPVTRHVWVRERLDGLLGPAGQEPVALAERLSLPWMLYAKYVEPGHEQDEEVGGREPGGLNPLPAARRRRGLTGIRGFFPGMLSALEFVRAGVTRDELIDFLRAESPEAKNSSLGVTINSYQSELDVIRREGDRYSLTERGESVLESQDSIYLADWLLTRILGVDKVVFHLREHGAVPPASLLTALRQSNPGWTTDTMPQAIVAWLRSMGVLAMDGGAYVLTTAGQAWADKVHWTPENLVVDVAPKPPIAPGTIEPAKVRLPELLQIVERVQEHGHFPPDLVVRLHGGLWSHARRHFAVLTGLSGSGKTLLAREYARALSPGADESRLLTLPVQPGWYDPGALLGFVNPLRGDSYSSTAFLEFLLRAAGDPENPYVVVLDEMNLSHPEQYMAPLLSAMETGEAMTLHTEDDFLDGVPASIPYPSNLALIGTVNMDETTHGLSDKVLDRAFVLEFWDVDLDMYPRWRTRQLPSSNEKVARDTLGALMKALAPARLHFGWRVVDDVLDFLAGVAAASDHLPFGIALDSVIYSKVLPKIRCEDAPRYREALTQCEAALSQFNLPRSAAKVGELRRDLETTGSARFWR